MQEQTNKQTNIQTNSKQTILNVFKSFDENTLKALLSIKTTFTPEQLIKVSQKIKKPINKQIIITHL